MVRVALAVALFALAGTGCSTVRHEFIQGTVDPAIRQAAFDYRCAEDKIRVVRHTENWLSVELDVCGKLRRYQYMSGLEANPPGPVVWVETTGGFPPSAVPPETR